MRNPPKDYLYANTHTHIYIHKYLCIYLSLALVVCYAPSKPMFLMYINQQEGHFGKKKIVQ